VRRDGALPGDADGFIIRPQEDSMSGAFERDTMRNGAPRGTPQNKTERLDPERDRHTALGRDRCPRERISA
jgi:hypothetical protein